MYVDCGRRGAASFAARLGRSRAPARDLVRLPRPLPARARRRRPQPGEGVPQRLPGRPPREPRRAPALRADAPAVRRPAAPARDGGLVDVLELRVHGRRPGGAVGLPAPPRRVRRLPQLGAARQPDRPPRLRPRADGAAAPARRRVRERAPRRARVARRQPVRGDAEPPRRRRADRRRRPLRRLAELVGEGAVGGVAGLGVVRRDGDRQPLLARLRRRGARRADRDGGGLPPAHLGGSRRSSGVTDRLATRLPAPDEDAATFRPVNRAAAIKHGYTTGARGLASRSVVGLTRTRITPNALTASGVILCGAASLLVLLEDRNEILWYWVAAVVFVLGSLLDILDGALARAGGKTTPFGAFLDSTTDRVSEGFMLTAIAYILARQHHPVFVAVAMAAVAGSFLVSYTRAKAEILGLRGDVGIGSRAERVVVITAGLVLAPWGILPWALVLLAATAWITVGQRVLHVRKQLVEANHE